MILPAQLFVGATPDPKRFTPPTDGIGIKPKGGIWTSSYINGTSDWIRWCLAESSFPNLEEQQFGWILYPTEANIIEVDTVEDCRNLFRWYGMIRDGYDPAISMMRFLDYPKMLRDGIDGVHVTEKGQYETRFSHPGLYGWDC